MSKTKYIIIALFVCCMLLLIPNFTNAATKLTYNDTEQGIEWEYEINGDNIVNLNCKTTGKTGKVEIPSTIDGKTVTSLYGYTNNSAFYNCAGITDIIIPNTIVSIPQNCFYNCKGLKTITLPDSITSIGSYAFNQCSGLSSINFSKNISTIENYAFQGCTGLKSISLPDNLVNISSYAFSGCSGLKSLTIPNSVTTIGSSAFSGCSGLKEVTLSNSLSTINVATFENCSGLTSIIIPESVTTILGERSWGFNHGAFQDCINLEKILIPDSVATIREYAFDGCSKLTIYGNDNMPSKEYAEANKIPFDYISNWDKKDSGSDITPPTVENITVTYASVMNYSKDSNKSMYIVPANAKLTINVQFSEIVEGSTVPTLTIKFGDGEKREVTEGTIGGSVITYIYTIKDTDKGTMTTVDYKGGDIKDAAGNDATLSCPALKIQSESNCFIYANGTATNPNNSGTTTPDTNNDKTNSGNTNNNNNSNNNNNNSNNNSNNSNTNNGSSTQKPSTQKDNTTANGKIPQTGVGVGLSISLLVIIGVSAICYLRYRRYRDI